MTDVNIFPAQYKDQPAYTLESELLRAQFIPGQGAKLAALMYKPRRFELLVQRPDPAYKLQPFDGDYVAGECSGLDDMFPTIDACYYDRFPWQGVKMADHGEVWSLGWEAQAQAGGVHFGVNGVRFPYRLEKRASFPRPDTLRLDYRLTNLSPFDFEYVWAAHMMINLEEGAELTLPDGVTQAAHTFTMGAPLGPYGRIYDWPLARLDDGATLDLRRMRPKATRQAYKYYIVGRLPQGRCRLTFPNSRLTLELAFPVEQVPYLGILPNEGGWQDLYNIFLEPCSATFDRPDAARYRGENSIISGKAVREWYLEIGLHADQPGGEA